MCIEVTRKRTSSIWINFVCFYYKASFKQENIYRRKTYFILKSYSAPICHQNPQHLWMQSLGQLIHQKQALQGYAGQMQQKSPVSCWPSWYILYGNSDRRNTLFTKVNSRSGKDQRLYKKNTSKASVQTSGINKPCWVYLRADTWNNTFVKGKHSVEYTEVGNC